MEPPEPSRVVVASKTPIIHVLSTPDLAPILARSGLGPSITSLLAPFEASVERVNVRSSTFEPRLLPRLAVHFVERLLPPGFGAAVGEGAVMHNPRARSTTIGSNSSDAAPPFVAQTTPVASQYQPTPAEREELFLESLSSSIQERVDDWIGEPGRKELRVTAGSIGRRKDEESNQSEQEVEENWKGIPVEELTPWYAAMRDEIVQRREMVEWDTFAWPVGCLLALSSAHPDPLNALSALWDLTSKDKIFAPSSFSPRGGPVVDSIKEWADPEVLRYIVLVHDFGAGGGRDGWEDAQTLHETIRKTYGLHTALLPLFSASPTAAKPQPPSPEIKSLWPIPPAPTIRRASIRGLNITTSGEVPISPTRATPPQRGQELSDDDLKSLRIFMREMVVQSLLPWMERAVTVGNEQYIASKRSIGGRLFSVGRKYFGGSNASSRTASPTSGSSTPVGFNTLKGFYPFTAQESQSRRLADIAFMIGDYKLAASIYEQTSKDYKNDSAWRYYSSACRMAGLAQLMMHRPRTPLTFNPDVWLELATQTPLSPGPAGVDLEGLRAMMLYYEAYRVIGDWRPAPTGLVRTAGVADEIASAILLEQAAIADLNLPRPSKRKYAFHMSMAAARYEKSGLKSLSRRCLSQASSVFRLPPTPSDDPRFPSTPLTGWNAIRSHLHHSLGRQAYNIGRADEALEHFLELLVGAGVQGDESVGESSWLDDFGLAWEALGNEADRVIRGKKLRLHATIFDVENAHVRILQNGVAGVATNLTTTNLTTTDEVWTQLEQDFLKNGFEGSLDKPLSLAKTSEGNEAVVGETFYLELLARNPLDTPLVIGDLKIETDAAEGVVEIDAPQGIELGTRESRRIYVAVVVKSLTTFKFTQLSFRFSGLFPCTESLSGKRKRLNATREQLQTPTYSEDSSLVVTVRSPVPYLSVSLEEIPDVLFAGEIRQTSILVTNTGQVPLRDLKALCSLPSFAIFSEDEGVPLYSSSDAQHTPTTTIPNRITPNTPSSVNLGASSTLQPGASISIPILVRGDFPGQHTICWLLAFRGLETPECLTARASCQIEVLPSLDIRPSVRASSSLNSPYSLGLEIQNIGIRSDVVITQISSLSPLWTCHGLEEFDLAEDLGPLSWKQNGNLFLSVEAVSGRANEGAQDEGTAFAVRRLDALLQGKDLEGDGPGDVELYHSSVTSIPTPISTTSPSLTSSFLQTHTQQRLTSLTSQLPTISASLHPLLFPLFSARSLDLLIFWSIPSQNLHGHHHLSNILLGAGTNALKTVLEKAEMKAGGLYAESQRERTTLLVGLRRSEFGKEENPLAVVVEVEEMIDHDFEKDGPRFVPVLISIRNLSNTLSLDYTLSLQVAPSSSSSDSKLVYSGPLTHKGSLSPLASQQHTTKLWITRSGVYDAGDWRLDAMVKGEGTSWSRLGRRREVFVRDTLSLSEFS